MPKPDDRIGPYQLIRKLGKGSFGEVWLARIESAKNSFVALKLSNDPDLDINALLDETNNWARAGQHPNIVEFLGAKLYDDQAVIISEYIPDGSLEQWLRQHGGRAPSMAEAIRMICGILDGLEHLHARKIIHRDLKPANILMHGDTPRLADFGHSRVLASSIHSSKYVGTPAYSAPEAFDAVRNEQTDLWSIGVILYEILAGRRPFPQRDSKSLIKAILMAEPQPLPSDVQVELRQVVETAMAKEPAERFRSATEMRAALLRLTAQPVRETRRVEEPVKHPKVPEPQPIIQPPKRPEPEVEQPTLERGKVIVDLSPKPEPPHDVPPQREQAIAEQLNLQTPAIGSSIHLPPSFESQRHSDRRHIKQTALSHRQLELREFGKSIRFRKSNILNEVLGLLLVFSGLLIVLCLLTYHANDPSWISTGKYSRTKNLVGPVGANIAGFIYQSLGLAGWLVPGSLFTMGWWQWKGTYMETTKAEIIGIFLIIASITGFLASIPWEPHSFRLGGFIGYLLVYDSTLGLARFIGRIGALVILILLILIGLFLTSQLSSYFGGFHPSTAFGTKKHPRTLSLTFFALLFGGLALALYLFGGSRFFALRDIELEGNHRIQSAEVKNMVEEVAIKDVWRANLKEIRNQLRMHDLIEDAEVTRVLPDRIHVVLIEREPVALVRRRNKLVCVDRNGMMFGEASLLRGMKTSPIINGLVESGENIIEENRLRLLLYQQLLKELDNSEPLLSPRIDEVIFDKNRDIRLILKDYRVKVLVGQEDFRRRLNFAINVLDAIRKKDIVSLQAMKIENGKQLVSGGRITSINAMNPNQIVVE